ncbi:MAG: hypothetical protein KAS53_07270 [Candidatus Cloacimonetes bacterium]|nr:hypothetical protein [Candidatus Cloacimonadota bacterium]
MNEKKGDNMNNEILHKEIDLIQDCIRRMAQNSFIVKGWMLSLVTIILTLGITSQANDNNLCLIILIPIIAFWYLDGFFLQTERKYQKMYQWIIENRNKTDEFLYDLNPKRFDNQVHAIFRIMFSKTILPLYLSTIIIIFLLFLST